MNEQVDFDGMDIRNFVELLRYERDDEDDVYVSDFLYQEGDYTLNGKKIEFVSSKGGGEGGGEYCNSVFKIEGDEQVYIVEFSYYSYSGIEYDGATVQKAKGVPTIEWNVA